MLKGKKILLGISGSIAAYKSIYLIRLFVKEGADVKVIMTPSAEAFVSKLTISTLSKNPVLTEMFDDQSWANHVMLGRWADLMIIAPLSCNTLSKMANGICDNLLMAVYLSAVCPVVVAPAMDEDMWLHASTKRNLAAIKTYGNKIISVESGELASGLTGEGRMAEPETILQFAINQLFFQKDLIGKKAMVTAGPTYEPIDPVRFISNHSSGKMGIAIANELYNRGATVTLIIGPTGEALPENKDIAIVKVTSAEEMYNAAIRFFASTNIAVMSAAVADYTTPVVFSDEKMKKKDDDLSVQFRKTKDILKELGESKAKSQVVIGFALETNNEEAYAKNKLATKNADMIILNSLNDTGAGFGGENNKITIYDKAGKVFGFETKTKKEVAKDIVDTMIHLYYA